MPFNFPNTPTVGQQISNTGSGQIFTWDGIAWNTAPVTASISVSSSLSQNAVTASFAQTASYYRTLYANLGRTTTPSGFGINSDISWETTTNSPEITVSGTNITLPSGTWMVNAQLNFFNYTDSTNGYLNVSLVNSSNVALVGVAQSNPGPPTATYNYTVTPCINGIFTLASPTTVKFRVVGANGTATIQAVNTRAVFTSLNI